MPQIEFVTVANHAEAINGLLYLQGAGLTDITQQNGPDGQPGILHVGIAVSIVIGWNEANRRYPLRLSVVHEDGSALLNVEGQVEAGRPPGLPAGSDLRSVLAVSAEIQFPRSGGYVLKAELDGGIRSVAFRVHQSAPPPPPDRGPTSFDLPQI